MVNDFEAEMNVERLSSTAYLRRELGDAKFTGSIMDSLHESSTDSEPVGARRDEEMVDIAIWLNVGIRDDFPVTFDHKWSNALDAAGPQGWIELARCPRVNLSLAVVADRNIMDGGFENESKVRFVADTKFS